MTDCDRVRAVVARWLSDARSGRERSVDSVLAENADLGEALHRALTAASAIVDASRRRARSLEQMSFGASPVRRYELQGEVGRGGMGVVRRAFDPVLGRLVALKTLPGANPGATSSAWRELAEARLRREAELTARLEHPGVPPVYEVGTTSEGAPYYAMRLVAHDRRTLASEIRARAGRSFDARRDLLEILLRVCDTVSYAHSKGVLHRDLKPDNVVLGDHGVVSVVDWGLAASVDTTALAGDLPAASPDRAPDGLTLVGSALGTVGYLSPEAASGDSRRIDARSEVFTLGVILFEVLTGTLPFESADAEAYVDALRRGSPLRAGDLDPAIPPPLASLCDVALSTDPSRRPGSVAEFASLIRAWRAKADADGAALRLAADARAILDGLDPSESDVARRSIVRARALVESAVAGAAVPELDAVRAACDRASAAVDAAERAAWERSAAQRRRRQAAVALAVVGVLGGGAYHEIRRSHQKGRVDERVHASATRRAAIEASLRRIGSLGLAGFANDSQYVAELVRGADAETVDVLAESLDGVTADLLTARSEVDVGSKTLDTDRIAAIRHVQELRVPLARQRLAQFICEALGLIRMPEGAVPALRRHLSAQYSWEGVRHAGRALARLAAVPGGGDAAAAALLSVAAERGLDDNPEFRLGVLSYLPTSRVDASALERTIWSAQPPPRPPHGAVGPRSAPVRWLAPAYVESWIGRGIPRDGQREMRDDATIASQRIEREPEVAAHWVSRGLARRGLGDLAGAEVDFTRAIELDPSLADAWAARADVRRLQANFLGAIYDCDRAGRTGGATARGLILRGLVWTDFGVPDRAVEDLTEAIREGENACASHLYRAMAFLGIPDFERAAADATVATRLEDHNAEAWNAKAVAELLGGRLEAAMQSAETAAARGDGYYLAWNSLAVARAVAGDGAGARRALEAALALDAGLPFAWHNLGVLQLLEGDRGSAVAAFGRAVESTRGRLAEPWRGLVAVGVPTVSAELVRRAAVEVERLEVSSTRGGHQTPAPARDGNR